MGGRKERAGDGVLDVVECDEEDDEGDGEEEEESRRQERRTGLQLMALTSPRSERLATTG